MAASATAEQAQAIIDDQSLAEEVSTFSNPISSLLFLSCLSIFCYKTPILCVNCSKQIIQGLTRSEEPHSFVLTSVSHPPVQGARVWRPLQGDSSVSAPTHDLCKIVFGITTSEPHIKNLTWQCVFAFFFLWLFIIYLSCVNELSISITIMY